MGGKWSYNSAYSFNIIWQVRLIQHEVSHNFGVLGDENRPCTPNYLCVMKGATMYGINLNDPLSRDVWCPRCHEEFSGNIHLKNY
jgi:hypothetical protein